MEKPFCWFTIRELFCTELMPPHWRVRASVLMHVASSLLGLSPQGVHALQILERTGLDLAATASLPRWRKARLALAYLDRVSERSTVT